MNKLFVDFHIIQTVPPSCVNRDDTGSPKTAVYGGARRARVSSQSWKRAMRMMFRDCFDESELGMRTKKIAELVKGEILRLDPSKSAEEANSLAVGIVNDAGIQTDKDGVAKALFFISVKQARNLAELALSAGSDKKEIKKKMQAALNAGHAIDIALFGRMVATDPTLNTDAASQVAHAISTHKVTNEFDYYTAVDDLRPEDVAGAEMIGVVEFNSSTLYRYATVAVHELLALLGDDEATAQAVGAFARAFALSMPTGKQNTFANRTAPDAMLVTLRRDCPVNLVGAFEAPVPPDGGYAAPSIARLVRHAEAVYGSFVAAPEQAYVVGAGLETFGTPIKLTELADALARDIAAACV